MGYLFGFTLAVLLVGCGVVLGAGAVTWLAVYVHTHPKAEHEAREVCSLCGISH